MIWLNFDFIVLKNSTKVSFFKETLLVLVFVLELKYAKDFFLLCL